MTEEKKIVSTSVNIRDIIMHYQALTVKYPNPQDMATHLQSLCGFFIVVCKVDEIDLETACDEFGSNIKILAQQIENDEALMEIFE